MDADHTVPVVIVGAGPVGLTRAFLLAPPAIRSLAFAALRAALRLGPLRRRILRRTSMLNLDYPASPLLDAR